MSMQEREKNRTVLKTRQIWNVRGWVSCSRWLPSPNSWTSNRSAKNSHNAFNTYTHTHTHTHTHIHTHRMRALVSIRCEEWATDNNFLFLYWRRREKKGVCWGPFTRAVSLHFHSRRKNQTERLVNKQKNIERWTPKKKSNSKKMCLGVKTQSINQSINQSIDQ